MERWQEYLGNEKARFLDEFCELLRIPSVSAEPGHKDDVKAAAEWITLRLKRAGMDDARMIETERHPLVYGEWLKAPSQPTVLFYGHYDVQPADPLELWEDPPFEPRIRDGRVFGRGASDMKGNLVACIAACEAMLKTDGTLPVNVKFLFEGEEEIGSPSLPGALGEYRDLFACDCIISTDSGQYSEEQPAIWVGLKGGCGVQIDVRSAGMDMHSGLMGGIAPNAIHILVDILTSMLGPDRKVLIEGFYDEVAPLSEEERREMALVPDDIEELMMHTGVHKAVGEPGYTPRERNWARPTFDVNGIWGGFQGSGVKTVIPCEAHAKLTCRLVPNQKPSVILGKIREHVQKVTPEGVDVKVTPFGQGEQPYVIPADDPTLKVVERVLTSLYSKPPYRVRVGGSVPATAMFRRILGVNTVGMGFSLNDENVHAPNEFMRLKSFEMAPVAYCELLKELSTL